MGVQKQAQISPPPFFCGCRLSAAAAGSHPPQKFPRWGTPPQARKWLCDKQVQISPPPFFFAAVACRRQRLEAIPPQRQQNPPCRQQNPPCRRQNPPPTAKSTADAGVRLFGLQQRRRQNPPLPQAFSWSGSRAAAAATAKSTVAAGVQLVGFEGSSSGDGKIHRCRRRSAGRIRGQQ